MKVKAIISLLFLTLVVTFTTGCYKSYEAKSKFSQEINFSNTIDYTAAKNIHFKY